MSDIKISQLPYIGKTGYTATDIIPFVNYINPTGTTSETKIDDLKDYILENSFFLPLSGGTVTGDTIFQSGLTANTISATTYYNLPIDPDTFTTGYTYNENTFTIKQNNGQPDLTATINSVTGWTVNGDLTVTGNTSVQSLTATTISATTYQNLPIDPDTYVTGFTYNANVFTLKQNNGQSDLTATIDSVTGWTVNGGLTVTGNTSLQGLTATTISATTYNNLPIDPDTFTTGYTYNDNTFTIKQNNGQPDLTATINTVTGMTVNGDLTVTGNTSAQGLTATTISATTFYGSGTNLTGVVKGSGTANYIPIWTGTTGLGNSIIQDDGTNVGIGISPQTPYKVWLYTSGNFKALRVTNAILTGSCIGIQVDAEGGGGASTGLVANSKTSFTGTSVGVKGLGGDGLLSIGVYGEVGPNEDGFVGTGIGGYFNGIGDGSYGYPTNSYGLQVIDGTEGINKVLVSKTSDGKSNWSSNLTGLTSVSATTVSASTLTLVSANVPPTPSVSTPFIDDYNRVTLSPGGTPSLVYTNTNTGAGNSTIVTNYLNINNGNPAGQSYTTVPLSGFGSPFNPTLSSNSTLSTIEWTFNLRTNRNTIFPGFAAGTYGGAVVLVGSNTNIQSLGSGYALVYGGTGTRNWRLINYNNGLAGTQTDVISGGIFAGGTNYVSVRIVYVPLTNTWTYYFRDDGAVAWGDPTTTSTLIGTAVDSTYTSTLMSVFGVFFNYSTAASQNLQFDNLRVQQTITPVYTPTNVIVSKDYLGNDVFYVKDDGSTTSTGGFSGTFSGTHTGDGSALVLGQSGIMVTGTSQLNLTSATTALTLIPGLSTTISVSGQTMVYIQTNGGVNTLATSTVGGTALDIAIIVDGAVLAAGGYQRMYADNPTGVGAGNVTNWVANWNTSVLLTLAAGSHTIEVDAVFVQGSSASVSGIANSIKQGTLTVMVLKNN